MVTRIKDKDTELVHRVRDGDTGAFRILVNLYKDKSLSLAVSIVRDEPLAEDILQDVFIKVYKNIKKFKFKSKFSTWLYRIVVNSCYNELKKQRPKVAIEASNILEQAVTKTRDKTLAYKDQQKYIQMAMAQLKTDEALVLRLFYLCEMSLKEIETISGYSVSKIRVDLHRGRKNMEKQLKLLLGEEINTLL
ncbi:RNA polymerase sigma factor [Marinirhabdus gelatinilytica]|uniref:RNA polymerase sigma factor n=1 Tax=Marinirhabdus gelatinilytica TaxID=1703343 RepID=A0A370QIZ5_9FLAO|nr:sigma-70 family RNA polymerase sigma factor [Marinirhabdus gelatinilytica]RDK88326.1 RNA polymerase sigma-70 factor (ECF subfamily) [Marinirhabdus gelatinilytica]